MLNATTLLVPGYVDEQEVEAIAKFIARLDDQIPYSLLVFYPIFYMSTLPITPLKQAIEVALDNLREELRNSRELKQYRVNIEYKALIHSLEEDMPIMLYYVGSGIEPSDASLKKYLEVREGDLINELKGYFI